MQPILLSTAATSTESPAPTIPVDLHNSNDEDEFSAAEILQNIKSDVFLNKSSNSKRIPTTTTTTNSDKLKRVSSDISNSKSLSLKYFDNKYGSKLRKNSSDYAILASGKQNQQQQNPSDLKTTDSSPLLVLGSTATQPTVVDSSTYRQPQTFFNLKKNGATLIFQKKSQKYCEDVKKRRSLQLSTNRSDTDDSSNRNIKINYRHSWYDQSYPDIKEELSVDPPESTNLAGAKNINIGTPAESASLIDKSHRYGNSDGGIGAEDATLAEQQQSQNPPRRRRIEQFLKSLVGKKPSREPVIVPINPPAPQAFSEVSKFPSEHNLLLNNTNTSVSTNDLSHRGRLLNTSTASLNSTSIVQQKLWSVVPILGRKDGNSCSNLLHTKSSYQTGFPGSPGLRKCETVLALTNEPSKISTSLANRGPKSQSLHERTAPHSKSISNLVEPIKPLNRLRYSNSCYNDNVATSLQTCSRCSSLLSLAATGSKYSLTTNGAFVTTTNKNIKSAKSDLRRTSHDEVDNEDEQDELETERPGPDDKIKKIVLTEEENDDDGILVDSLSKTNSSNNLILNDFNEIEPYDKSLSKLQQPKIVSPVQQQQQSICKLCLGEYSTNDKLTKISSCGCYFCTEVSVSVFLSNFSVKFCVKFYFQCHIFKSESVHV